MKTRFRCLFWLFLIFFSTCVLAQKPESTKVNTTQSQKDKNLQGKNEKPANSGAQVESSHTSDAPYSSWSINWTSVIISFFFFLVVYIVMQRKISSLKNELKELEESRVRQRRDINSMLDRKGTNKSLTSYNFKNDGENKIEQDIKKIKSELSDLDIRLSILDNKSLLSGLNGPLVPLEKSPIEQILKPEILYASIPTKDGSFNENAVTNTMNPTASFYKFIIIDSFGKKANFEFLGNEERAVKDATNAPERILRPACKINNALNQNAKRIKTIAPGIVIKQNGKWEVDTLAEIEYE